MSSRTLTWSVRTPSARYEVEFRHNTLSGQRLLWIDGALVFRSGVRYRLTGSVTFFLESDCQARISINPHGAMDLHYSLSVNDKLVELGKAAKGTVWMFDAHAAQGAPTTFAAAAEASSAAASSAAVDTPAHTHSSALSGVAKQRYEVEFDHDSFDVLVNRRIVVCEAEFLDDEEGDGSAYTVPLGGTAGTARIVVLADGRGGSNASLTHNGTLIARLEDSDDDKSGSGDSEILTKGVKAT